MASRYAVPESDDDSDSNQLATSKPSDEALEKALRDAVAKIYQSGKLEELTVKRVRLAAERALGLEEGFFKGDSAWKSKSDQTIKDEVEVQDRLAQEPAQKEEEEEGVKEDEEEENIPLSPKKTAKPTKRAKPTSTSTSRKRRKTETPEPKVSDDEETGAPSDSEDEVKNLPGRQSKTKSERASAESDAAEEAANTEKVDSESEMSVVLDEEPKPSRKRGRSSESTSAKGKKKVAPAKSKDAGLDPNEAEIKRLQGWLVKCGIRKVWSRELAPYDTPKAKIKHLKDMLKDAGMDGRYSLEKAKQIKEKRELEADLAMIKEGEKHWGRGSVEEESDSNRPQRRLNRSRQTLAFLESEGEETD
ncbi:hypothetical protein Asppvi_006432 [Aspergillus pseudoviridinutans]|uniref:Transcriptional regulator n=1 Tax=Aspergillus pseudoviridinutans TaxID=1517512 RepID=A0A9P3BGP4_9EURO|nr:uncharacterized protein Asppvi_006432 [Aspergillus pseudoviridinutans]GIJ87524.1 hypothetical protein Asppvi_006432 [Aspergillus pseudoviridinutans]